MDSRSVDDVADTPSFADLPPFILGEAFRLLDGRRHGMAVLLTCKQWHRVAQQECPSWWEVVFVDWDNPSLARGLDAEPFLARFHRTAKGLRELRFQAVHNEDFSPLLGTLLNSAAASPALQAVEVNVLFEQIRHYSSCCQALAKMGALRRLSLDATHIGYFQHGLPLAPLELFSRLTQLESLELHLPRLRQTSGKGPFEHVLPKLVHLTRLHLTSSGRGFDAFRGVRWRHSWDATGAGRGPMLRHLHLDYCDMGMEPEQLLPSLQCLERLALAGNGFNRATNALCAALPQLERLTSISLGSLVGNNELLPAALRCPQLRELAQQATCPMEEPPPGSLEQLSRLAVPMFEVPAAWWERLAQLKSLRLHSYREPLPYILARLPSLEDLEVDGCLTDVTQAVAAMTRLTRLVVRAHANPPGAELCPGDYLPHLRELTYSVDSLWVVEGWRLPACLAEATSLEVLDLSGHPNLRLRPADAELLGGLPRLRQLLVPMSFSEVDETAVGTVREELLAAWAAIGQELAMRGRGAEMIKVEEREELLGHVDWAL